MRTKELFIKRGYLSKSESSH